jgi:hypothetical protein
MTRKTWENRNTHIRSIDKQVLAGAKAIPLAETVQRRQFCVGIILIFISGLIT